MTARAVSALGLLIAVMAVRAPSAWAQAPAGGDEGASASARARYNAGTKAFADKRFVEAALDFEAAASEKASPVALYTAALSWEQANAPDRAADDYTRALATPGLPADRVTLAKERLAALDAVLGAVAIAGPDGARAQLDANTEVAVPATLHATPGTHTLVTRAPDRPIEHRPVVLEVGKTVRVEISATSVAPPAEPTKPTDATPPPASPPPAAAAPTTSWRQPVGFTMLGLGAAFLGSGAVFGAEAIGARDAYKGAPTQATYDHALELQTWTNIAFIAGGVLAAGGIALVVWPSSKPAGEPAPHVDAIRVTPGPGSLLVQGRF